MSKIYLRINESGWALFDSANTEELTKKNITIGDAATIGDGTTIGDDAKIG